MDDVLLVLTSVFLPAIVRAIVPLVAAWKLGRSRVASPSLTRLCTPAYYQETMGGA